MSVVGCSGAIRRGVLAVILSSTGSAEWAPDAASALRRFDRATTLAPGSIVRTDSSPLGIGLVPGVFVEISPHSELQITELAVTKNGNDTDDRLRDRRARVRLKEGSLVVMLDSPARFAVETSQLEVKVTPGCLFRLTTKPDATRVTCIRGKIYTTAGTAVSTVEAGYTQQWPSDEPAKPTTAEPGAQSEANEALQTETLLREATARHRGDAPIAR